MAKLTYELIKVPNLNFSTMLNGYTVTVHLRTFRGIVYASVYLEDKLYEAGRKAVLNQPLFTGRVNRKLGGEFMFEGEGEDYLDWNEYGDRCRLVFVEY